MLPMGAREFITTFHPPSRISLPKPRYVMPLMVLPFSHASSSGVARQYGECDEGDAALMAHLEATTADKIAIANPKWR